jgi:hypothetical protein
MGGKIEVLLKLMDRAIKIANEKAQYYKNLESNAINIELQEMAELTFKNLNELKIEILNNNIPRPSGGATLGLSKNIGEWCRDSLYEVAAEIDDYYKYQM